MKKQIAGKLKPFHWLLLLAILVVAYSTYMSIFGDPHASFFLGQKPEDVNQVTRSVWLKVLYIHITFACIATIAGALNFTYKAYATLRKHHKKIGYVYFASLLIVDLTSGYMAVYATGGKWSSVPFNLLNIYWIAATVLAIFHIRKNNQEKHRNWMIRSYVFCFVNFVIHIFTYLLYQLLQIDYTLSYTLSVYLSLIALLAISELLICKLTRKKA